MVLIEDGAEVNARDWLGMTALMWVVKEVCELLTKKGIEVNAKNKNGWTTLISAAWNGHKEVYELLKAHGATS